MSDKFNQYHEVACDYVKKQIRESSDPTARSLTTSEIEHLCSLGASIMMTRDKFVSGGGFVQAIVNNDLDGAISRADTTAIRGLRILVMVKAWCHL